MKIVYIRNGETVVLTGWRAWLAAALALLAAWVLLAIVAFLVLGFAVTLAAILLLSLPAIGFVALIHGLANRRLSS